MRAMRMNLSILALVSLVSTGVQAQTPKDTIVIAKQIDDILTLDPAETYETSGIELDANVYDRLVRIDLEHGNAIVGALAESWDVSPDQLSYSFKLRPGVKFQSGNPLTAADAVYSIQRAIALNKTPAFILTQFGFTKENIAEKVKQTGDLTFVMTVSRPFAPTFVLNCLTSTVGGIVDSKLVKANEKDGDWGNAWLKLNSAGSGAYRLRSYRPNEQFTLDANEGWYRGVPKNKRVIVRHVPEPASQRLLLEKGDIDIARNLSKDQLESIQSNPAVQIVRGEKGYIMYLGLNQKNAILAKPEVREALKWLVDYKSIERNLLYGTYTEHQSFLPNGYLGAIGDNPYSLDIPRARELLAKAGYPNGFSVTMDVRSASPWTEIAQAIQSTWAEAGIKLELIPGDYRQTLTKYRGRAHDIYLGYWAPDYLDPHSNAEAFASNADNSDDAKTKTLAWRNSWDIPAFTSTTQAALLEPDPAKRAALYQGMQRDLQRVSPFVIMFQQIEAAGERRTVSGWVFGPGGPDTNFYATVAKQ